MCQNRVLLWTTAYADLLTDTSVGGIGVQMMFWVQAFANNGWKIYSLYNKKKPNFESPLYCVFKKECETHFWSSILYLFFSLYLILCIRPKVILCRGGKNRNLLYIAFWCRLFHIKLVQFLASDADLNKKFSNLSISGRINTSFFRWGLGLTKYIVAQNYYQKESAETQFKRKKIIIIPNIWGEDTITKATENRNIILWVGNTRKLKRPQWVFEIAKSFPNETFIIIGGNADNDVYKECDELSKKSFNVKFLGGLSFFQTNQWFCKAKALLCTSEYEGFPNTFLQAWANTIPVLSTVNPNNVITKYNLGYVCNNPDDFKVALKCLFKDKVYIEKQMNINKYFYSMHSLQANYNKLFSMLNL